MLKFQTDSKFQDKIFSRISRTGGRPEITNRTNFLFTYVQTLWHHLHMPLKLMDCRNFEKLPYQNHISCIVIRQQNLYKLVYKFTWHSCSRTNTIEWTKQNLFHMCWHSAFALTVSNVSDCRVLSRVKAAQL
jgi:hypothetical protein